MLRRATRASASIDSGVRDRCLPRNDGIAQNAHARSQPSAIFTYAHGAVGAGRGSSSRSRTPVGLRFEHDVGERAFAGEPDDRVGLGQRGGQLLAVPLGHAAGDDELGAGLASRPASASATSIDSWRAASMNAHVLTTTRSASSGAAAGTSPSASREATTLSESTAFFGQPSVST